MRPLLRTSTKITWLKSHLAAALQPADSPQTPASSARQYATRPPLKRTASAQPTSRTTPRPGHQIRGSPPLGCRSRRGYLLQPPGCCAIADATASGNPGPFNVCRPLRQDGWPPPAPTPRAARADPNPRPRPTTPPFPPNDVPSMLHNACCRMCTCACQTVLTCASYGH
jgi:hypothetical protein